MFASILCLGFEEFGIWEHEKIIKIIYFMQWDNMNHIEISILKTRIQICKINMYTCELTDCLS